MKRELRMPIGIIAASAVVMLSAAACGAESSTGSTGGGTQQKVCGQIDDGAGGTITPFQDGDVVLFVDTDPSHAVKGITAVGGETC